MSEIRYRPNPAQDTLAECHRAGWMYVHDAPNYDEANWLDKEEVNERLLRVAERGAEAEGSYITELAMVAISACIDKDRNWMILPVKSLIDARVIVEHR